jgi:chromosome partitioning protein
VVAVLNQKGGVGKSTLAFHLAHAARRNRAGLERQVLCLDMDSQGNLSQFLTGNLDVIRNVDTGVGLLMEGKVFEATRTSAGIDLLHGHEKLDRYDNNEDVINRCFDMNLRESVMELSGNTVYDTIVIDTPPAMGLRHAVGLLWADVVVIPMEPIATSIAGFQNVLSTIVEKVGDLNPGLKWVGVINRANLQVRSHREKEAMVRELYGDRIIATLASRISVSDAMEEEPAIPVWSRRRAPKDLRNLWQDVCEQILAV